MKYAGKQDDHWRIRLVFGHQL